MHNAFRKWESVEDSDEYFRDQKLTGLGGWLAFYVFGLCLGALIFGLTLILSLTHHPYLTGAGLSVWTITFLEITLVTYGIVNIWMAQLFFAHKKIAIKYVKIFLVAGMIFSNMATPLLIKVLDKVSDTGQISSAHMTSGPTVADFLSSLIVPALWFLYFQRSRRVRLTLTQ